MAFRGALNGIKVLEFGGLAPGPLCGKVLADFGATVIKVDQPNALPVFWLDTLKKSMILDLKKPKASEVVTRLSQNVDVIIDPFRPGILEKFGIGPKNLMEKNPKLVYAQLSGFGQSGPLSQVAGHDINYVALSGVLSTLGRKESNPTPPINLLADFAGGGLLCAMGIVLSLFNRTKTGKGQLVDASMSEGAAYVSSWLYASKDSYLWTNPRGENVLDSGAHFYDTYETKDGLYMSVGAVEGKFYQLLLSKLGLDPDKVKQMSNFDSNKKILAEKFKEKTQKEWIEIFDGTDACVMPVLSMDEAPFHPHNQSRKNFHKIGDQWFPTPSPRLIDANGEMSDYSQANHQEYESGKDTVPILKDLKFSQLEIDELLSTEAVQISSKL